MKKVLLALSGAILVLGSLSPAMADHENQPGNSNFGHCTAITHMNQNGYDHGNAFRVYDHIEDSDDSTDDFAEAQAYCLDYLADNHPGNKP
jgi:hypothetical protein